MNYVDYAFLSLSRLLRENQTLNFPGLSLFTYRLNRVCACIICFEDNASMNSEEINNALSRICTESDEQYYVPLSFGASEPFSDLSRLAAIYGETVSALAQKLNLPPIESRPAFTDEQERQLAGAVAACDRASVCALLDALLMENIGYLPSIRQELFMTKLHALAYNLIEKHLNPGEEQYRTLNAHMTLAQTSADIDSAVSEVRITFTEIMDAIEALRSVRAHEHHQTLIDEVLEYIQREYTNHALSVTHLAERFDMPPVQLSRMFRDYTGIDLPGHISGIRVKKAAELIESGGYGNLNDLAEQVGFGNSKTLIRSFKRVTGTTPGQYKRQTL